MRKSKHAFFTLLYRVSKRKHACCTLLYRVSKRKHACCTLLYRVSKRKHACYTLLCRASGLLGIKLSFFSQFVDGDSLVIHWVSEVNI